MVFQYRKAVYKSRTWLKAAFKWKTHFLSTQVPHKQHSNRSQGLKMVAQYPWRAKFYQFLDNQNYILNNFVTCTKSSFAFAVHVTLRSCLAAFTGFAYSEHCTKAALELSRTSRTSLKNCTCRGFYSRLHGTSMPFYGILKRRFCNSLYEITPLACAQRRLVTLPFPWFIDQRRCQDGTAIELVQKTDIRTPTIWNVVIGDHYLHSFVKQIRVLFQQVLHGFQTPSSACCTKTAPLLEPTLMNAKKKEAEAEAEAEEEEEEEEEEDILFLLLGLCCWVLYILFLSLFEIAGCSVNFLLVQIFFTSVIMLQFRLFIYW